MAVGGRASIWVLRETVLALQERLLAEFGGLGGLRDEGVMGLRRVEISDTCGPDAVRVWFKA